MHVVCYHVREGMNLHTDFHIKHIQLKLTNIKWQAGRCVVLHLRRRGPLRVGDEARRRRPRMIISCSTQYKPSRTSNPQLVAAESRYLQF
jgi:hypothetical protein